MGLRQFLAMLWAGAKKGKEPKRVTQPQQPHKGRNRRLKVFGERNTGTRAATLMLRAHRGVANATLDAAAPDLDALETQVNARLKGFRKKLFKDALLDARKSRLPALGAWKHAAPMVDDSYAANGASVLFMVRDPYSWITALYRNPYHIHTRKPDTIEAFLQEPWLCLKRDNIAPVLASPMQLWSAKLQAYRAFAEADPVPSTVLHFEAFVREPVLALGAALRHFDMPTEGLAELQGPTKHGGMQKSERVAFYDREDWARALSPTAVRLINAKVDWALAAHFGYHRRQPDEFATA